MADAKLASSLIRMRQRRTGPLILELDLTDGITEGPPADPLSALLTMRRTRLQDLLEGLKRAAADDRVRVLVVKVGGSGIGLAKVQELRAAIGDFRQSGKLAVAWSESFGDFVHGNVPYYLATGFDRIYLQPSGTLGLTGVAVEQVFLHGALEKLGIEQAPSSANFILGYFGPRAVEVRDALRDKAILVRDRSYEIPGGVRITAGSREQAQRVLDELERIW